MFRHVNKLVGIVLMATLSTGALSQDVYQSAHHDYRVVPVAEDLVQPWSMAWLPNGDMLITEKPGRLRMVRDGQLLPEAIPGTPEVLYKGQGGLFEVVPHPDFNENQWVYLTFAKPNANEVDDGSTTAIARGRLQDGRLTNVVELFAAQASGFGHYGGKLVFDGEGHMFLTLGDRQDFSFGDREALMAHSAQDRNNHKGVIVRLNDDGTVPDDNPFVGVDGVLPEIWSYGHRSPQGLAIHPITGDLWESEHGPQAQPVAQPKSGLRCRTASREPVLQLGFLPLGAAPRRWFYRAPPANQKCRPRALGPARGWLVVRRLRPGARPLRSPLLR